MRRPPRPIVAAAAVSPGRAGRTGRRSPPATTTPPDRAERPSATTPSDVNFGWEEFGDTGRVQTGSLQVPIDYDDPTRARSTCSSLATWPTPTGASAVCW